MVHKLTTGL